MPLQLSATVEIAATADAAELVRLCALDGAIRNCLARRNNAYAFILRSLSMNIVVHLKRLDYAIVQSRRPLTLSPGN